MPSRMDYIDAALGALATVMPNEQPIRIVLREVLVVLCFSWLGDRDPAPADLHALRLLWRRRWRSRKSTS